MKAALIPPIPSLGTFGSGDFHLLLSHLLEDPRYLKHYQRERERGAYLCLDNSAHEHGAGDKAENLANWAKELNAQEVVVPDALEDAEGTVERAVLAHEAWYEGDSGTMVSLEPALMYVPQGADRKAWQECLSELVGIHNYTSKKHKTRKDFVVGISKDYEVWGGGILQLLVEDIYPLRGDLLTNGVKMHVHLLGWGRHLWRLEQIASICPWIRSTDSAKPFVYALKEIDLVSAYEEGEVPTYPKRPAKYFSSHRLTGDPLNSVPTALAYRNVNLFRLLAGRGSS